jgi:chitin disaccharide deacetylase
MKKLIVSADDFGLTEGINEGIIRCAREGIVTSASIMANTPAFENAVTMAKQCPGLATGVHLNLVKGKPLLPTEKIRSLVDNKGIFYTLPRFTIRLVSGGVSMTEAENELRSQIEKVIASGLKVTHLDSHRHFHVFPSLIKLVIKLAVDYKINTIRCPLGMSVFTGSAKEFILSSLARNAQRALDKANIRHNGRFFELVKIEGCEDFLQVFQKFCQNIPEGVTELDCHPGLKTSELDGIEATIHNRERQVEILTNPALPGLLKQHKIELVNYRDIS